MNADIWDRLEAIATKQKGQNSRDIRAALKEIKELSEQLGKAYDERDSYIKFCRHFDAKRKEVAEMLVIATRLMEYQKDPT